MCPLWAPLGRVPLMWRHAYTMYCSFMFYIFFLLFLFTFCFVLFRVLRHSFSFLLREKGHTLNQATLGATRGGSDPPVVILIIHCRPEFLATFGIAALPDDPMW